MNKIIMFLILTAFAYPAYVTFNVDMSAEDIEEEAVYIWMGYEWPDPGFLMNDTDGDDVWSITVYLSQTYENPNGGTYPDGSPFSPGTYTYKYRVGDWPEWDSGGGWDDITGQDCAVGQWADRYVVVEANDMVLDPVCWGSCAGGDCQPGEIYDVTFQLDMNDVDGFDPATGVYVNIQPAWCGLCNLMLDDDGDGIWTLTLSMEEGIYQYIYLVPEWDEFAGGAPLNSGCDYVPGDVWPNYGFNLSGGDITLDLTSWGECPEGTAEASIVTFDIDGVDDCGFVSVSGTFDAWSGWGATTDTNFEAPVAPGDHEFQVLCVDTNVAEWYNDIWAASTVLTAPMGSECDFDPTDENNNYGFTIGSETTLTVSYCAGTCNTVCGDPVCGDGVCNGDETIESCPVDCDPCGDGECDCDETAESCPEDCDSGDTGVIFSAVFGGAVIDGNTYTNPTGSESWAGFANEDLCLYPFSFADGGEITFTGATAGTDVDVYFRFEYNPHPDTDPSFNTAAVTVSGIAEASYSVDISAQGANTYSSFLLYVTTPDAPVTLTNVAVTSNSDCPCALGDVNCDGTWNVLDIVALANCVLAQNCAGLENGCAGDMNGDGGWNVLDIVNLANCVLASNCSGRVDDASEASLIKKDNQVSFKADGFIGGVEMTLFHSSDFTIQMTDRALFADYLTTGNETRLLVITPETEELFSFTGEFEITEVIVANSQYEVSVNLPLAGSFRISEAYPNPFNPTTQMSLTLNIAANVSVNVFNMNGQLVDVIADGQMSSGTYSFTWNGMNAPSGIYFIKTEVGREVHTQKIMLIK